jgi:hypothetical protein
LLSLSAAAWCQEPDFARLGADLAMLAAQSAQKAVEARVAAEVEAKVAGAIARRDRRVRVEHEYREGTEALDGRQWERAVEAFDRVAQAKGERADAALYWKAYAQHKLGRREEALATLAALQSAHSASRWMNDARKL